MASYSSKKEGRRTFSGNHQRSWLWGHHAVTETMRAGKWPILEIFATREMIEQSAEIRLAQSQASVSIEVVSASRLEQLVRSNEHQGIIARLGEFPYLTLQELLSQVQPAMLNVAQHSSSTQVAHANMSPLVVVCDRIQDAFNFGAILRCCEGAAVCGVIVSDKCQAEVTPHVARSSSGAVNYVSIARTSDLIEATKMLKEMGLQVVAADSNATTGFWETNLGLPTALIVGSEAHGIQSDLLALSDHRLSVPMFGRVTSLNAAVATGILLYEIRRQSLQRNEH